MLKLILTSAITIISVCGGYLTARRGTVSLATNQTSRTYDPNQSCQWVVSVRRGRKMKLTFTNLDILSDDSECGQDYLMVSSIYS